VEANPVTHAAGAHLADVDHRLFAWLGESTRLLIWIAAGGLAGLLVVYLTRVVGTRLAASEDDTFVIPTHVRDLDIRPETLPADIGAAARQLWERGEQRAALALLYRGMLSRLAHVHGVPIRDSSTEGDCLALATAHLPEDRSEYLGRLVRLWQRFGYGRENVESGAVYRLCEFATALRHGGCAPQGRHDAQAVGITLLVTVATALLVFWIAQQHVLGGREGADAAEGRSARQSVLCRAAVRRNARRDDDVGSHVDGCPHRRGDRGRRAGTGA
jgi:hypothetical protein